jgi:alkyldihydroxyacetonephosphate synthase
VDASCQVMQGEFGMPAIFRISDPEETDRGLKLYGMPSFLEPPLQRLGFEPMRRCLCMGNVEGDKDYTRLVARKIMRIALAHGAVPLGGYAARKWEHTRYTEPYMREDLNDFGIITDTLETSVTWDVLHEVHQGVRAYVKSFPGAICMTHASHFYPEGTNLYFIFLLRMEMDDYIEFQAGVVEKMLEFGGTPSHHHGIGRLLAPWLEPHLGKEQVEVLKALKRHFDPNGIMNPGGQLGLDGLPPLR